MCIRDRNYFWCWIKSLQDAILYPFHLLDWDLPLWKSIKLSNSLDSFDALNGASCGESGYYDTGYLRWGWHWRAAVFLTFQKLLTWCWPKKFPSYSIVHTMRYFEVEIFSGWSVYIYSFQRELDCCSGNILVIVLTPVFTVGCLLRQGSFQSQVKHLLRSNLKKFPQKILTAHTDICVL